MLVQHPWPGRHVEAVAFDDGRGLVEGEIGWEHELAREATPGGHLDAGKVRCGVGGVDAERRGGEGGGGDDCPNGLPASCHKAESAPRRRAVTSGDDPDLYRRAVPSMSAATRPSVPRTVIQPPTTPQVRAVLALAAETDDELSCWLQVAVATGARRGEICALRWGDIDFDDRTVRIERSVSATRAEGLIVKTTKTGGVRRVSLAAQAIAALSAHHTRRAAAAAEDATVDTGQYVFTSDPSGTRPWRPELVTRRWERIRGTAGLAGVRVHDLRHYVATELLTAGIDARTVAHRLGHARTSTTLDRYWAWVPAGDRDAASYLELLLQ